MTECLYCSSHAPAEIDLTQAPLPGNKRRLFFFVGETHEDWPRYSHGVRQAVLQLNTTPGKLAMRRGVTRLCAVLLSARHCTASGMNAGTTAAARPYLPRHPSIACEMRVAEPATLGHAPLLVSDILPAADAATEAQQLCSMSQHACCRIRRAPHHRSLQAEP